MKKITILIVDDDPRLLEMIRMILENRGYQVIEATNGEEAITMTKVMEPDLILLDVMMPVMDGFTACKRIRDYSSCPIIMLTAKGEDYDQVAGLENGADDYMIKPFTPMVLAARIEAVLRRVGQEKKSSKDENSLVFGEVIIDIKGRSLILQGNRTDLKRKEFDLLVYLATNHGISLSRGQILEKVWGYDYLGSESTVDTHVNRLRKQLGSYGDYLQTVRGYGYRFEVNYEE
jgi:DNA-binding response OmpR family regulator